MEVNETGSNADLGREEGIGVKQVGSVFCLSNVIPNLRVISAVDSKLDDKEADLA